jgi:hypothetical protein
LTQSHQTNKREPEKWQSNFDIDSGRWNWTHSTLYWTGRSGGYKHLPVGVASVTSSTQYSSA